MSDVSNIFDNNGRQLPEEKLMAYLEGKLSEAEKHEVELWLAGEGMESDAIEGLRELPAKESKRITNRLNQSLRSRLKQKKYRRRYMQNNAWAWLTVIIVLLLAVLAYIVVRMSLK